MALGMTDSYVITEQTIRPGGWFGLVYVEGDPLPVSPLTNRNRISIHPKQDITLKNKDGTGGYEILAGGEGFSRPLNPSGDVIFYAVPTTASSATVQIIEEI